MARLKANMHRLLTKNVLDALFGQNINTIMDFLNADLKQICRIISLPYKDASAIRKHLVHKNSAVSCNGLNYYNELKRKAALLSTKIPDLDTFLNGGLITGNIYEVCGLPSSGKTRFSLTLVKNIVQTSNQQVYYLDTRKSFSSKKLMALLEDQKCSHVQIGEVLSKILVRQMSSHYELLNTLYEIKGQLCSDLRIRLIVINSLPAVFYQNINYVKNYGMMNHLSNIMNLLAREYHIVIVVVNIITTWFEADFSKEEPCSEILGMGKYWKDVPQTRIIIKKTDQATKYQLRVTASNNLIKDKTCVITL